MCKDNDSVQVQEHAVHVHVTVVLDFDGCRDWVHGLALQRCVQLSSRTAAGAVPVPVAVIAFPIAVAIAIAVRMAVVAINLNVNITC